VRRKYNPVATGPLPGIERSTKTPNQSQKKYPSGQKTPDLIENSGFNCPKTPLEGGAHRIQ
jgi:hypothetical protein